MSKGQSKKLMTHRLGNWRGSLLTSSPLSREQNIRDCGDPSRSGLSFVRRQAQSPYLDKRTNEALIVV